MSKLPSSASFRCP